MVALNAEPEAAPAVDATPLPGFQGDGCSLAGAGGQRAQDHWEPQAGVGGFIACPKSIILLSLDKIESHDAKIA